MEKLVKLLNEAHRSGAMLFGHCYGRFEWKFYAKNQWRLIVDDLCGHDDIYDYSDRDICGKDGGFIERLVENDKINFNFGFIYKTYDEDELGEKYSDLDSLLMILSIQDNPLDYLCSILKE